MANDIVPQNDFDAFLDYLKQEGRIVFTDDGVDIYASQAEMAEYFGVTQQAVARTIKSYAKEDPDGFKDQYNKMLYWSGGAVRPVTYYNSNILIYVGYRVHGTEKARLFRDGIAKLFRGHVSDRLKEAEVALKEKDQIIAARNEKIADMRQINNWLAADQRAGHFIERSLPDSDDYEPIEYNDSEDY